MCDKHKHKHSHPLRRRGEGKTTTQSGGGGKHEEKNRVASLCACPQTFTQQLFVTALIGNDCPPEVAAEVGSQELVGLLAAP